MHQAWESPEIDEKIKKAREAELERQIIESTRPSSVPDLPATPGGNPIDLKKAWDAFRKGKE